MRQGKAFQYSIVAGWFITALAAFLLATILIPEESRSAYFWHRLWWMEFLVFLFWASTGLYLLATGKAKDHATRFGGVAPTISIVIAVYAMLSFAVMIIHALVPTTDAGNRIHVIGQIVLFTGAALCIVFLSMARAGAAACLDSDKTKAMSPRELHDLLALRESLLPVSDTAFNGLRVAIKQLSEVVLYSLNESADLSQSVDYRSLNQRVQQFCATVERTYSKANAEPDDTLIDTAKELTARIRFYRKAG